MAAPAESPQARIDYTLEHDAYRARVADWNFNEAHVRGGRALYEATCAEQEEYLPRFHTEAGDVYENRLRRSRKLYYNLPRRAVAIYLSQLFREVANREVGVNEDWLDDVDLRNTTAHDFFRDVSGWAQVQGVYFVLVNSPEIPEGASQGDVREMGLHPYFEKIKPQMLVDWDVESPFPGAPGKLSYAKIKDKVRVGKTWSSPGKPVDRYRILTRNEFIEVHMDGSEGKVVNVVENPIGEVPVVPFYEQYEAPMQGSTQFDDVCLASNSIWNAMSVADHSFYFQGFPRECLHTDKDVDKEIKLSEYNAYVFASADKGITFVAPPATTFDIADRRIEQQVRYVTDTIFQRSSLRRESAQVESFETRELERDDMRALLERKAGNAERGERRCWEIASAYQSVQQEVTVEYSRKFTTRKYDAEEWESLIRGDIMTPIDRMMQEHPGLERDAAERKLLENRAENARLAKPGPMERAGQGLEAFMSASLAEDQATEPGQEAEPEQA